MISAMRDRPTTRAFLLVSLILVLPLLAACGGADDEGADQANLALTVTTVGPTDTPEEIEPTAMAASSELAQPATATEPTAATGAEPSPTSPRATSTQAPLDSSPTVVAEPTVEAEPTNPPTPTSSPTPQGPAPTATPEPTAIPPPTATLEPTATPEPTVTAESVVEPENPAPEIGSIDSWHNSPPLTLASLRGTPVLLVFWADY